jgi:hypothetical protein
MRKFLTFFEKQNPRRGGQGSEGGWVEARRARCQPKDPRNSSVASKFLQARSLSNILALWTIALASIAFAVCSPAAAQMGQIPTFIQPPPSSGSTYTFLGATDNQVSGGSTATFTITTAGVGGRIILATLCEICSTITAVTFDPSGANVALSLDYAETTSNIFGGFYSANITAGQAGSGTKTVTVTYTGGIGFQSMSGAVWLGSNLATGFVAGSQGFNISNVAISSTASLLFALNFNFGGGVTSAENFSTTTPNAPSGTRLSTLVGGSTQWSSSADWALSTGSYTVTPGATNRTIIAATYK